MVCVNLLRLVTLSVIMLLDSIIFLVYDMDVVPATFEVAKIDGVPQEFKKARFMAPLLKGYWVTLYCFFDGERIHHFFHQSEMLDNAQLARECGYTLSHFFHKVLVTPDKYPEIFNAIESYVSRSNSDQEP